MELIDLKQQYANISEKIQNRINTVLAHGKYIMGPEVHELEERLSEYVGVKHCISVSSGTDALVIALMSIGVGPGDEVIVPAFSFIATAESVALLGAKPVFVDIDSETYNISVEAIKKALTSKTRAIIPVSLFGQCPQFDEILSLAKQHELVVIEDAAQSFGATYKGQKSCSLGDLGCTSFFPSKPLGCYGDGGAIFTNDDALAREMRKIRIHGQERRYHHTRLGINGRLDTLQAAVLLEKLAIFDDELQSRYATAEKYRALLSSLGKNIRPQKILPECVSVYAQFTIACNNRDHLAEHLQKQGIPTAIHYPETLPKQPVFNEQAEPPNAAEAATSVLSLPMHPYLSDQQIEAVASGIRTANIN